MNKEIKKAFTITILLLFVIWIFISTYLYLGWFNFEEYFSQLNFSVYQKIMIILTIFFFRNYLLIPSTVIIVFTWFFLQNFWISLITSIIWVSIWIFQTYFVWYLLWENLKNNKNFNLINKYKDKIEANWFKVIFIWALFPVIIVDILYYSAWFIKYNFIKSYLAWILWEMPLIILYAYLGKEVNKYIDYLIYIITWILMLYFLYELVKILYFKKS
jgi:uncharacterized membrane protein YdjX (TVP38/TMEM64 family)